ncbi:MAG TPA: AfsR/SARP family transcriptional regulator [Gaiellaceae bacterium]|nr:AfsR/SARP family transcriptional regulator [Gaiellaceae bacterium]
MGRLRYLILGPLEVRDGGAAVPLRGGQQRKLLAILLLHHGEAVSSDRLIEELWDGNPPVTAAKALQGYVSSLRKQLGPETVDTVGAGYRMEVAAEDVDARRFEALLADARPLERAAAASKLREALALWRGPALADFAYDDFAQSETERLEDLRLTCTERRIDLELALGHHVDLVPELEALVRTHPLHERLRGHLMIALYRSGRQAEALDVYSDARSALLDGLGLEPSEELQALQRKILAHDESLAAPARVGPPGATRADLRFNRPLAAVVVGLALLGAALAAVLLTRGGSAAIVVPQNSVARIDEAGTKVESFVNVGRGPVAVAVGAGGVWVANAEDGTVDRLDPAAGKLVANIGTGADVNDITTGFGSVWVAGGNDGSVTQIDPRLGARGAPIQLGGASPAPNPVFYIAVDSRYVWATRGDELLRIDPKTSAVSGRVTVGTPTGLTTGGGSVWVTTLAARLLRIDARTAKETDSQAFSSGLASPVYTRGALWLLNQGQLQKIDPTTLGVDGTASVPSGYPVSLAAGNGALWALDSRGNLTRFTPDGSVTASLHVGKGSSTVAAGGGATWVAVTATG